MLQIPKPTPKMIMMRKRTSMIDSHLTTIIIIPAAVGVVGFLTIPTKLRQGHKDRG